MSTRSYGTTEAENGSAYTIVSLSSVTTTSQSTDYTSIFDATSPLHPVADDTAYFSQNNAAQLHVNGHQNQLNHIQDISNTLSGLTITYGHQIARCEENTHMADCTCGATSSATQSFGYPQSFSASDDEAIEQYANHTNSAQIDHSISSSTTSRAIKTTSGDDVATHAADPNNGYKETRTRRTHGQRSTRNKDRHHRTRHNKTTESSL